MSTRHSSFETLENRRLFAFPIGAGSTGVDVGDSIAADRDGNVFVVGTFQDTVDFDPGAGTAELAGGGGFVAKYAADGSILWARRFAGAAPHKVATDGGGNVYAVGSFTGTVDFNPRKGAFEVTSAGGEDAFLLKLSGGGNLTYVRAFGGAASDEGTALAVAHDGRAVVGGTFEGRADFDAGPGVYTIGNGGSADGFLVSVDAADGEFEWAGSFSGATAVDVADVALDGSGNVLATGSYTGAVDFNPSKAAQAPGVAGTPQAYALRWDSTGGFLSMSGFGGTGTTLGSAITADRAGNIYTVGNFSDTADFNPGGGTFNLTAPLTGQVFVSKLDSSGVFVWAKAVGGAAAVTVGPSDVAVDKHQQVYLTGRYTGTQDFDPDAGTTNLTAAGLSDVFVTKLAANGALVFARSVGGTGLDQSNGLSQDYAGNILVTGQFTGTGNFATTGGAQNLTSNGDDDLFALRLTQAGDPA